MSWSELVKHRHYLNQVGGGGNGRESVTSSWFQLAIVVSGVHTQTTELSRPISLDHLEVPY